MSIYRLATTAPAGAQHARAGTAHASSFPAQSAVARQEQSAPALVQADSQALSFPKIHTLPTTRPAPLQMQKAPGLPATGSSLPPLQMVKHLKDENWQDPQSKYKKKYYRLIHRAADQYGFKNSAKRNLFVLRLRSASGKKRLNLLLRSAGMGGVHPRGIGGRSAGHTEPQAAAILRNPHMLSHFQSKLGKNWTVDSVFSSNQPCSSSGGGSATGCGGMDSSLFNSPSFFHTAATGHYVGGKGLNQGQTLKALEENDDYSDGSDDEFLDEDEVRGADLTTAKLKPFNLK